MYVTILGHLFENFHFYLYYFNFLDSLGQHLPLGTSNMKVAITDSIILDKI